MPVGPHDEREAGNQQHGQLDDDHNCPQFIDGVDLVQCDRPGVSETGHEPQLGDRLRNEDRRDDRANQ